MCGERNGGNSLPELVPTMKHTYRQEAEVVGERLVAGWEGTVIEQVPNVVVRH